MSALSQQVRYDIAIAYGCVLLVVCPAAGKRSGCAVVHKSSRTIIEGRAEARVYVCEILSHGVTTRGGLFCLYLSLSLSRHVPRNTGAPPRSCSSSICSRRASAAASALWCVVREQPSARVAGVVVKQRRWCPLDSHLLHPAALATLEYYTVLVYRLKAIIHRHNYLTYQNV